MKPLNPIACTLLCIVIVFGNFGCAHTRKPDPPDVDALIAQLAQPVTDICAHDPEICALACARCADVDACMNANGRCAIQDDRFIDVRDGGLSPFVPGCHMQYQDNACTANGAFFWADRCARDRLYEWWNPVCHPGMGDLVKIDCRRLCVLMHRPGGTCEYIANACPGNQKSGRCICDPPQQQPIEP